MKLVETDSEGPLDRRDPDADSATPPRPEHRRVSVSLLLTASVLVGTVVAVYAIFPARHNVLMTRSLEVHREPPEFVHREPTHAELRAWGLGFLDRPAPWPEPRPGVSIMGVASISVLNQAAAVVRYRAWGSEVTLVVQRARSVPPRTYRRWDGDEYVVSWHKGKWTLVAVGPAADAGAWTELVGAP
jgi:hypothetical protein